MKKLFAIALALMLCICALSVCAFAAEDTITIYVSIESETAPNAWAWGDYGNAFSGWPGEAMTKDGEYWTIEVPVGTTGFIANNGTAQTSDITIAGTEDVYITVAADYSSYEVEGGEVTPPAPDAYYVAGSAGLCGVEWDPAAEANKMTEGADGVWSITYSNVAAGSYELKVTGGSWASSWGTASGSNIDFTVEEGAEVIVTFNPATNNADVLVNGELVPETGDMGLTAVAVALVAATAGLAVALTKKKEF